MNRHFRKVLLSATALTGSAALLLPGATLAQSPFDWSGFYVGGSIGGAMSSDHVEEYNFGLDDPLVSLPIPEDRAFDLTASGPIFGATVGYNAQMGSFVLGAEADASLTDLKASLNDFDPDPTVGIATSLNSLLTLRGRLGFATGNMLFYGTAGIAGGDADFDTSNTEGGGETSGFTTGIVAGAGVEVAVNDNVSIKTEGLVYKLSPLSMVADGGKLGDGFETDYTPSGVVVRTGVNFHF